MKPIILLDNGHGIETKGKRSPVWNDGTQLLEYDFNRRVVNKITAGLKRLGITYRTIVPEINDIPLSERCKRINKYPDAILISVHANAGGGKGFECFTSYGDTKADPLATIIYNEAMQELEEFTMRNCMIDGDPDKESQFYILKNTKCPAILTENLFMDNKVECDFLMSEVGQRRIASFHISAIKEMLNSF